MEDMGDDGSTNEDMSDVLDPTMLMGEQRGGQPGMKFGQGTGGGTSLATLKVQTLLALQELGVVVGVAFMVIGIFMLMIFMEKMGQSVMTRYHERFGKPDEDVEDPASLVGTFKRYK